MSEPLVISASQLDDFLDCPRRWWFKRVLRLKEVQKGYFTFGTVLHGCIERWMAADATGRVPYDMLNPSIVPEVLKGQLAGAAVDVFPPGWETVEERGAKATVTPNEARLIRRLFTEAVERGIIARAEGVTVEREIRLPVLEGVELLGYLDLHLPLDEPAPPEIHDHKSFGESSVRYLKQPGPSDAGGNLIPIDAPYAKDDGTSPNSVGHNQQVLTYGAATSIIDGYDGPVLLRHNQFPKFDDPKGVRKVEALVSSKRLKQHWAFVQDTAKRMLLVRGIKKWTDTPGPESLDSCSRFGGCPFQGICGKRETTEVYSQRIDRTIAQGSSPRLNLPTNPRKRKTKEKTMAGGNIFKRAQDQQAARGGTATAEAPVVDKVTAAKAAAKAPAINSAPAPVVATATDGAPWAKPDCPACKGYGVNSNGRACPICDKTAQARGKPTSSMYAVNVEQDGTVTAVALEEHTPWMEQDGIETAWAGSVPKPSQAAPGGTKTTPKAAPAPVVQETAQEEPQEQPVPVVAAKTKDSPFKRKPAAAPATETVVVDPTPTAVEPPPTPVKAEAANKGGRPKQGITILIGVSMLQGPERPRLLVQTLLDTLGAQLAADMGAESYWALDPFKRRERIRQKAGEIAESLGKTVIIVTGTGDPDVTSLVNGLIPYADVYERLG